MQVTGSPAWFDKRRRVRVTLPDGSVHELLSGFFARVINNLTTPQGLLALVKRFPEQLTKIIKESESEQSIG